MQYPIIERCWTQKQMVIEWQDWLILIDIPQSL